MLTNLQKEMLRGPWCGFVLRSLCLVYAYNMALGWLWVASED